MRTCCSQCADTLAATFQTCIISPCGKTTRKQYVLSMYHLSHGLTSLGSLLFITVSVQPGSQHLKTRTVGSGEAPAVSGTARCLLEPFLDGSKLKQRNQCPTIQKQKIKVWVGLTMSSRTAVQNPRALDKPVLKW